MFYQVKDALHGYIPLPIVLILTLSIYVARVHIKGSKVYPIMRDEKHGCELSISSHHSVGSFDFTTDTIRYLCNIPTEIQLRSYTVRYILTFFFIRFT